MQVNFGQYGSNVALDFVLTVSVFTDNHDTNFWQGHVGQEEVMYDEYPISLAFDLKIRNQLTFITLNHLGLV